MRRVAFYLFIGLSAFGIGLLAVFSIYFKRGGNPPSAQTIARNEPESKPVPVVETPTTAALEEIVDEERNIFTVLKPTIRKWLAGAPVKSVLTYASDESIVELTGMKRAEVDDSWYNELRFIPTLMDFNGDGKNELAVTDSCAMVGNCRLIVLRQKGKSYETILETEGGAVQTFILERTKTNGYFDLKTTAHGDAWSGGIEIYKFDGKKYKVAECSDYNYSALVNGKHTVYKKPRITRRKCAAE